MTTPKNPEQIIEDIEALVAGNFAAGTIEGSKYNADVNRKQIRSSMSSLLCYMAERMPEHTSSSLPLPPYKDNLKYKEIDGKSCITEVDGAYNAAIDDCRCILVQMADGIWKE